jgi:hypothetical protein
MALFAAVVSVIVLTVARVGVARPSCLRLSPRDRLVYWRLHGGLTGISLLVGEVLGGLSFLHSRHL